MQVVSDLFFKKNAYIFNILEKQTIWKAK